MYLPLQNHGKKDLFDRHRYIAVMPQRLMETKDGAPIMLARQDRLLSLIDQHPARIVEIISPAGFGKTALALSLAQTTAAHQIFPRTAEQLASALERERHGRLAVVLDDVDGIPDGAIPAFASAIELAPEDVRIVLCSRRRTALHEGLTTPPHERLVLTAADLAFRPHETLTLLEELEVERRQQQTILDYSEGWPVAVLSMAHCVTADPKFDPLNDYLDREIVGLLERAHLRALLLCSAMPGLRRPELVRTLESPSAAFELIDLQLARYDSRGGIVVRPLLARLAYQRYRSHMSDVLACAAQEFSDCGNALYASAAFLAMDEPEWAADALRPLSNRPLELTSFPFCTISRETRKKLDTYATSRFPELWVALLFERQFSQPPGMLIQDARDIAAILPPSPLRNAALAMAAMAVVQTTGKAAAEDLLNMATAGDEGNDDELMLHCARAMVLAHAGRPAEAAKMWVGVRARFWRHHAFCTQMMAVELKAARTGTDARAGLALSDRMCSIAEKSGSPVLLAYGFVSGIFTAWLYGDDKRFDRDMRNIRLALRQADAPRLEALADAFEGKEHERFAEYPIYRGWAKLAQASKEPERAAAAHLVREAVAIGDGADDGALSVTARLILSELEPPARAETDAASARIVGSEPFLNELRRRFAGLLERYALRSRVCAEAPLTVEIATGSILRDGHALSVSLKTAELIMALAAAAHPVARDVLVEQLWPEREPEKGRSSLKMAVHRARQQLAEPDAILVDRGMYALGTRIETDARLLWHHPVPGAEMLRLFEQLSQGRPSHFTAWPWFHQYEDRLVALTTRLGLQLAGEALSEGHVDIALRYASVITNLDPCDETAAEVAIRAHLERGERNQALSQYRRLLRSLRDELDVEPSDAVRRLLRPSKSA